MVIDQLKMDALYEILRDYEKQTDYYKASAVRWAIEILENDSTNEYMFGNVFKESFSNRN